MSMVCVYSGKQWSMRTTGGKEVCRHCIDTVLTLLLRQRGRRNGEAISIGVY